MKPLLIRPAEASFAVERTCQALANKLNATTLAIRDAHPLVLLRAARVARDTIRRADVVNVFGGPALTCAIAGGAARIVYTPLRWPTPHAIGWLRAAMSYREIDLVCSSDALRRTLVTRGVPIGRTHLVRPGVDFGTLRATRTNELRQRIGIADTDRVFFAPGPITRGGGHANAMWGISIANILDPRYRVIVHDTAGALPADTRQRLMNPDALIDAAAIVPGVTHEELFDLAHALLVTPTGPIEPLVIATAMASGKPIIATPTPQVCEMLEDRHTALLVTPPSPHRLAERIADLFADERLMWQIADRARAEAYDYFTQSSMLASLRDVYEVGASGATKTV